MAKSSLSPLLLLSKKDSFAPPASLQARLQRLRFTTIFFRLLIIIILFLFNEDDRRGNRTAHGYCTESDPKAEI